MHDYLSLEYYPKELTGKERVFQPISSYMKGKIDVELLLNAYTIILGEERIYPTYAIISGSQTKD